MPFLPELDQRQRGQKNTVSIHSTSLTLFKKSATPPLIRSSFRPANTSLVRSFTSVPSKFVARAGGVDKDVEIIIVKRVPLDNVTLCNRRDSQTLTGQGWRQTRIINHNNASGQVLRILGLPSFDEVVLDSRPNSAVNTDSRSTNPSTSIGKGIGETISTEPDVSDSRIQESTEASVSDSVVFNLRSVSLDAKPDEVVRDLVPDHFHFREIVHAQTNEPILRPRGTYLVAQHSGVDGAGSQKSVLGRVE